MTGLITCAAICAVLFIYAVRFDARMEARRRTRDADKFRCALAAERIRQIAADTLARECETELDAAMERAVMEEYALPSVTIDRITTHAIADWDAEWAAIARATDGAA